MLAVLRKIQEITAAKLTVYEQKKQSYFLSFSYFNDYQMNSSGKSEERFGRLIWWHQKKFKQEFELKKPRVFFEVNVSK